MRIFNFFAVLLVLIFIGCSSGKSPVTPDFSELSEYSDCLPVIGLIESGESSNAIGMIGAYEMTVNSDEKTAELVTKRVSALGESYIVSGLSYFTTVPCKDCLAITGLTLTGEGYVKINFDVRHPFNPGDPLEPPSAKNRLDLDIFDTTLIIMPKNRTTTYFPKTYTSIYHEICPHADGFTRELSQLNEELSACPYYLIVDDSESGVNTFNKLAMGQDETINVYLNTEGVTTFDLYLTMGYGASATFFERLDPQYFNPEFNRKNAWKVEVIPPEGDDAPDPENTWTDYDSTTPRTVTVKVWDWQHGCTDISNPPVGHGDIAFPSNVAKVQVEIPGMLNHLPESDTPVSGTGINADDPLVYEIEIANERLLSEGKYPGLVRVLDEREPLAIGEPGVTDSLINVPDGVSIEWLGMPEYATYQVFTASVVVHPCNAFGALTTPPDDVFDTRSGENVIFILDVEVAGGNLAAYWVDWGTGDYTESNTTGEFEQIFIDDDCPVFADDTHIVRFGVEMDCNPGFIIDIDEVTINVTECPLCYSDGSITLPSGEEYDAESAEIITFTLETTPVGGNIISYWADWGSGEFTESSSEPEFTHQYFDSDCPFFADDRYFVRFGTELDCYSGNIVEFDAIMVNISTCPICNATGEITSPTGTEYDAASGELINFVLDVVPEGGEIVAYWADWGSGSYEESSALPEMSHRFIDDDCPSFANDIYIVNFAVEMDCNPGYMIFIDTITINLTYCPGDPNPVDDLTITVNRLGSSDQYRIHEFAPFTLTWADPGGDTFDYAIYRDSDPSDGLINNLELVGISADTDWDSPSSHLDLDGMRYVEGASYVVYSRNIAGSEASSGSQIAHVIVSSAETAPYWSPFNSEGWTSNNESGETSDYEFFPFVSYEYPAGGSKAVWFGHKLGSASIGRWKGISRETPDVPDSTVRILDFSMEKHRYG